MSTQPIKGVVLPEGPATLEKRILLEVACQKSFKYRAAVKRRCMWDCEWFIDYLLFTYDPRKEAAPHHLPFLLWDFQRDYLAWIEERYQQQEDGLTEKSRDMGATWINLAWDLHKWLFEDGFTALLGSRKEDLVSNATTNSLFGRLEYMLRKLPKWLLPSGFNFKEHLLKLSITNPANGNIIEGESANAHFSRQGRYSVINMDEGAFWDDLDSAWRAAGDATNCRFIISTPNWEDWKFQEIRDGDIEVFTIHYTSHPKKDAKWLEKQRKRKSEMDIQQELEINYNPQTTGRVYPTWEVVPKEQIAFKDSLPLYCSIDFGISDPTALIWAQRDPITGSVDLIDCYSKSGQPADFFIPFITGVIPTKRSYYDPATETVTEVEEPWPFEYTEEEKLMIAKHQGWGMPTVFGDPAGRQRAQSTGTSVFDIYRMHKIQVTVNDKANDFGSRYTPTQYLMRFMRMNWPECAPLDEAIINARFPNTQGKKTTNESTKPIHDRTSHFRTSLEYLCVNLPKPGTYRRFKSKKKKLAYQDL